MNKEFYSPYHDPSSPESVAYLAQLEVEANTPTDQELLALCDKPKRKRRRKKKTIFTQKWLDSAEGPPQKSPSFFDPSPLPPPFSTEKTEGQGNLSESLDLNEKQGNSPKNSPKPGPVFPKNPKNKNASPNFGKFPPQKTHIGSEEVFELFQDKTPSAKKGDFPSLLAAADGWEVAKVLMAMGFGVTSTLVSEIDQDLFRAKGAIYLTMTAEKKFGTKIKSHKAYFLYLLRSSSTGDCGQGFKDLERTANRNFKTKNGRN